MKLANFIKEFHLENQKCKVIAAEGSSVTPNSEKILGEELIHYEYEVEKFYFKHNVIIIEVKEPVKEKLFLGKFTTIEALEKAYKSLEAEFTKRSQKLKELEKNWKESQEQINKSDDGFFKKHLEKFDSAIKSLGESMNCNVRTCKDIKKEFESYDGDLPTSCLDCNFTRHKGEKKCVCGLLMKFVDSDSIHPRCPILNRVDNL